MAMVGELIKDITRAVEYLDSHFTINIKDVHKPEGKSLAVSLPTTLPLFFFLGWESYSLHLINTHVAKEPQGQCLVYVLISYKQTTASVAFCRNAVDAPGLVLVIPYTLTPSQYCVNQSPLIPF